MKEHNQCLNCDCYDQDMGCTMPSIDRSYACELSKSKIKKYYLAVNDNPKTEVSFEAFASIYLTVHDKKDLDNDLCNLINASIDCLTINYYKNTYYFSTIEIYEEDQDYAICK